MKTEIATLELTVIGSALNDNSFYRQCELTSEMFVDPIYRNIWNVISNLISSGEPVDAISIMDELKSDSLRDILIEALSGAWSRTMGEAFATRIKKNHKQREIKRIASELVQNPDTVNAAISQLMAIGQTDKSFDLSIAEVLKNALNHIELVAEQDGLIGITTGLERLDNVLGGFHSSDLVVIAARPAMGKTALMLNMLIKSECSAGVFSAEMGSTQIGERIIAISANVEAQKLRRGDTNNEDFNSMVNAVGELTSRQIRINDKPAPTLEEIVNQARKWKLENKVEIIFLDYLQRIKMTGNAPRHEQVGEAARTLKELARELEIPVVVLAQVSRSAEGVRPNMSHLAQSGEIEAEADQIMFLFREEVYNDDPNLQGLAEILIAKNRHGATGDVRCTWFAPSMQFRNISHVDYN